MGTVPTAPTHTPPPHTPLPYRLLTAPHLRRRPIALTPPDSATGSAQFLPPTRKPHRAAPPQRASSPRAVPPHRRLPHPQRRPPSRPVGKRRSIIATVPDHDNPIPPLLCAWRAWLIYYATHVRGYAVLPGVDFRRHALSVLWISPESPSVTPYGNKAKFTKPRFTLVSAHMTAPLYLASVGPVPRGIAHLAPLATLAGW